MKDGAFALVDCLGFKGIWRSMPGHDPEPLIQKLKKIQKTIDASINGNSAIFRISQISRLDVVVRLLSDTVAISVQPKRQGGDLSAISVPLTCIIVATIQRMFIEGVPSLVMRGCITYGAHICTGNFIAGPAVDLAAENMNVAEGAFVWLHPNAEKQFRSHISNIDSVRENEIRREKAKKSGSSRYGKTLAEYRRLKQHLLPSSILLHDYSMPLKNGAALKTSVVNPFVHIRSEKKRIAFMKRALKAMESERLDVWLKRQNTQNFLAEAAASTQESDRILKYLGL